MKKAQMSKFKFQNCKKKFSHQFGHDVTHNVAGGLSVNSCFQQGRKGFTLIEMLVVLFIFAIVGILSTQSLALSLRGSKKSENLGVVRENVDYAMNLMERSLRGAVSINCINPTQLDYVDNNGDSRSFSCLGNTSGHIALDGERLTSSDININCDTGTVFACPVFADDVPPSIEIDITAVAAGVGGAEGATYTSFTRVMLRNY